MTTYNRTYIIIYLLLSTLAGANIKGTVVDSETKEPLIGANVYIEGTTKGSATDANGSYFISNVRHCSTCEYKLKVMYIGYENYEYTISVNSDEDISQDLSIKATTLEAETTTITASSMNPNTARIIV